MKLLSVPIEDLTDYQIARSLMSTCCPACTSSKTSKQSFCKRCYRALSRPTATALYDEIGNGYERSFVNALDDLCKSRATIPATKRKS